MALAYVEQGKYPEAEVEYKRVLEHDPRNARAHLGMGDLYRLTGRLEEALIEYREVLATDPTNPAAHYGIGVVYRLEGKLEEAVQSQQRVLEHEPGNLHAYIELSYTHYLLSRQYIARTGEYRRAWWLLTNTIGDIYGIRGEYPNNVIKLRKILDEDPCNTDVRFILAKEYENHGRTKEAIRQYRKLLKCDPNHSDARLALAELYSYDRRTHGDAINQALILLKSDPENFDLHLRLARLYSWRRQFDLSVRHYQWCLAKKPDNTSVPPPPPPPPRFELAQVYSYQNHYDQAIRELEIILAIEPGNIEARMELARYLAYKGDYEGAMREYEIVLQKDPNNYAASYALAELYSWDRRYYYRAIDLYTDMARRYPNQVDPILEVGRMHYERGELAKAEQAYRQAVQLHPEEVDARMALGRVYFGMNRYDEAAEQFREVIRLDGENVEAHYYMARIYALDESTYDKGVLECRTVLASEPDNVEVRVLMAKLLGYQNEYHEATVELEKVAFVEPLDPEVLFLLGEFYSYDENYEAAIDTFAKVIEIEPDHVDARIEMGVNYTYLDRYAEAIDALEEAVRMDPWSVRGRRFLARAYDAAGDVPGAIDEYKRILVIDSEDEEAREYLENHGVDISDRQVLLDSFYGGAPVYAYGGARAAPPAASGVPPGERMSDDELAYRARVAEEMTMRARYQRAIIQYRKLVEQEPDNPYYHIALGNVYRWSGYWRSATKEYERALELDPDNAEAKQGLAAIYRKSAPYVEAFLGHGMALRFNDRVGYWLAGGRFVYRFWNNALVTTELTGRDFFQDSESDVLLLAPRVELRLSPVLGLEVHGGITYNWYDRVENTLNWDAGVSANILDFVAVMFDYMRRDVVQTIPSIEEGIFKDSLQGRIEVTPIERLRAWGLYERAWYSEGDDVLDGTDNVSDLIMAGASYRFMNNPSLTVGYMYTYLTFDDQIPELLQIYWSPAWFMAHQLPIELDHQVRPDLFYFVGAAPGIGRVKDGDWEWSVALWGGLRWTIDWQNELEFRGDYSFSDTDWAYNVFLLYRHYFALPWHKLRPYYDEEQAIKGEE